MMIQEEVSKEKEKIILIVDDYPSNLKALKAVLSEEGYLNLVTASSGSEALERIEEKKPDLVLLDIMIPDIDGYDVCRTLTERKETSDIPVIMLTAKTKPEDLRKGFEVGAFDYIKKPFDEIELIARVGSALKLKQSRDEFRTYRDIQVEHLDELVKKRTFELKQANENLQQEITERKQAEDKIKLKNEELQLMGTNLKELNLGLEQKVKKRTSEIEAAYKELKTLSELKSKFVSIASHELRTPLIAIQGYIDLLLEEPADKIGKEQLDMLRIVSKNAERLTKIVTELLDVSRMEENRLILRQKLFSIREVIEEFAIDQKPILKKRNLTLSLDFYDNLPDIYGDEDRIAQVITNLIGNAIKYTPDGGLIKVKTETDSKNIHIRVIDNGIGIKERHIKMIFQPFYEVGEVTKHRTGKDEFMASGTGLGLSIVEGIVKAHGGKVWAQSEYGKGSVFHVVLPIMKGEVFEEVAKFKGTEAFLSVDFDIQEKEETTSNNDSRFDILVIGFEEDVLDLKKNIPEDKFNVFGANTSGVGIKKAVSRKPDLIIIDAWMPSISGYEVCKILKGNVNTMKIPVIIFAISTNGMDMEKAFASGADGYITKPFKKDEIIKLIENSKER